MWLHVTQQSRLLRHRRARVGLGQMQAPAAPGPGACVPTELELQIPEAKFIPAPSPMPCITFKPINKKVESTTALLLLPATAGTSLFCAATLAASFFFLFPAASTLTFVFSAHTHFFSSRDQIFSRRTTLPPWLTQSRASVRALIKRSRSPRGLRDSTAARAPRRPEPQRPESAVPWATATAPPTQPQPLVRRNPKFHRCCSFTDR